MGTMSASDAAPLPRLGEVFFDVRGNSRSMRLSWYADTGVAVLSIWQGGMCTGTFRLAIADLPRMVETLQRGPAGQRPEWDQEAGAAGRALADAPPHTMAQVRAMPASGRASPAGRDYLARPAEYGPGGAAAGPAGPPDYLGELPGGPRTGQAEYVGEPPGDRRTRTAEYRAAPGQPAAATERGTPPPRPLPPRAPERPAGPLSASTRYLDEPPGYQDRLADRPPGAPAHHAGPPDYLADPPGYRSAAPDHPGGPAGRPPAGPDYGPDPLGAPDYPAGRPPAGPDYGADPLGAPDYPAGRPDYLADPPRAPDYLGGPAGRPPAAPDHRPDPPAYDDPLGAGHRLDSRNPGTRSTASYSRGGGPVAGRHGEHASDPYLGATGPMDYQDPPPPHYGPGTSVPPPGDGPGRTAAENPAYYSAAVTDEGRPGPSPESFPYGRPQRSS